MTKQHFRLMSIELNPDEEVAAVRAMATAEAADLITGRFLVGIAEQGGIGNDGRRLITLLDRQLLDLHTATGKINGLDPDHEITTEIYDSLCIVVNGLMEEW